ncbi:1-phosphatidylinositol-3-phosphate 5-kinase [Rhizophlyctis rosea]|nr:1-phosphatidylinositol-3-phosphate 5-kinase [Rhizophlyctis rosea]
MSDYGADETGEQWDVPGSLPNPTTPRPSITGHVTQPPPTTASAQYSGPNLPVPGTKHRMPSTSPEVQSMEGLKRLFAGPRAIRRAPSEEVAPEYATSSVPFRSILDDDKASVTDLSVDLMDPEIALYTTDDEVETPSESWMFNLTSNYGGGDLTPEYFSLLSSKSSINDDAAKELSGKAMSRLRIHRSMKNEELRQQFTRDKMKRRSLSLSHARSTKFSSRSVTRQISRATLAGTAESMMENAPEYGSLPSTSITQRHWRGGSIPPNVELNPASLTHMRRLLRQVLHESDLEAVREWEGVLMNLMLKVCDNVQPDVRAGDDIDIRHYVKIKKVSGGTPHDSEYVHGVACSKNVAHKKMVRPVNNPKILLLTFALEYERVENQFLSLEPVLSQEREHLKNLVARILALKPDVVLVEKTVARLALEFLLEANVAVAYNVKPSVIEALARCTRADVISSIDKLALEPQLGSCELFHVKTFMHPDIPGYRKSFLYFEGCPRELGCTLMLRGANVETLAKLKQIADLMAFVVYNLKLETFLFRDQYAALPQRSPSALDCTTLDLYCDILTSQNIESLRDPNLDRVTRAIRLYQHTILSVSPHVRFPPPYLLVRMKEQERQMTAAMNKKSQMDKSKPELVKMGDYRAPDGVDVSDPEAGAFAIFETTGLCIPDSFSSLETRAGISYLLESAESLSPFGHQSIMVLYWNSCAGTTIPCQAPEQHLIEYYRATDMTLGQYLEELYFNSDFICASKLCDRKMLVHFRSYAHWQGRVNVVIEQFPCPVQGMEATILMWSACKQCGHTTPYVPMSEETWKYSFGKYLELWYYCAQSDCRGPLCSHNVHIDYIRFFGLKNLAVRFEYDPIDLLEVTVPPMRLRIRTEQSTKLRQGDADGLRDMITRYFDSISERIKNFTYEIVAKEKVQACKEAMMELGRRAGLEKKYMLQLLQQTMISSAPSDTIALNGVFRALHEKVTGWDIEFANFVRTYLQSDTKEIRRMTAAQIRRMFADRDGVDRNSSINGGVAQESPVLEIEMTANPATSEVPLPNLGSSPSSARNQLWLRPFERISDRDLSDPRPYTYRRLSLELMRDSAINKDLDLTGVELPVELPVVGPHPSRASNFTEFHGRQPISPARTTDRLQVPSSTPYRTGLWSRPSTDDITLIRSKLYRPSIEWLLKEPSELEEDPMSPLGAHAAEDLLGEDSESIKEGGESVEDPFYYGKAEMGDDEDFPMEWNTISGVSVEALEGDKSTFPPELLLMGGERTSIMKTITNLWTGNAANFLPLEYPISATEHVFPDSLVVVREDEPSSIIAFTLNSKHYKEKLLSMQQGGDALLLPPAPEDTLSRYSIELDDQYGDIEETLLRGTGTHIRYQFWDGTTRMNCKIFFAEQFDALRRNCGCDETFVQSLARCVRWDTGGGKSGSTFLKTRDDRYVVKQLSRPEMDALYKFAPAYFEYMSQAFFHELPTVLAKIFGFYRISFKNPTTGRSMRMDLFVMENLFYERKISRIFDLKGSMRNRHVQSTGRQNEVLLDENLVEFIYESPLFIREHSKKLLRASVWNDTLFLSKLNVMDYSLLVGIDEENNELVVGIVDYIRTFTWDKKLESWVKETAFLGGGGKEPTIVSPRQYKNRFREAMERYFLMVPDKFTSPKSFRPPGRPM